MTQTSAGQFSTTDWTRVLDVQNGSEERLVNIVNDLMRRYWEPIYAYLRRSGRNRTDAADLTQGFFCDVVINRDLIASARRSKGRFRTLLLTALDRYVIDEHRIASAMKRIPAGELLSIEAMEGDLPDNRSRHSPEAAFHHAWAVSLVHEVLAEVEANCVKNGQEAHWQIFEDQVVRPLLQQDNPSKPITLAVRLGLTDAQKVRNMGITIRRKFKSALRRRLRSSVASDEEVDEELADLIEVLSHLSATDVM